LNGEAAKAKSEQKTEGKMNTFSAVVKIWMIYIRAPSELFRETVEVRWVLI
jgi:hypothetical protein